MKITVLGAGAWGTALAAAAAARHEVLLWARSPALAELLQRERRNLRYLPELVLPPALQFSVQRDAALMHARGGLLVVATPMAGLREQLGSVSAGQPLLWVCKGFEAGSGALGHEIAAQLGCSGPVGVLSGPSFALEVARGQPTALVAASRDAALCEAAVQAFHSPALRIYTSSDPLGVEVGGAVKNVLAIATGIVDGLAAQQGAAAVPGLNARAALITRGLAEMTRLGVALGARADTFMGLSGLGDLVLTATGALSRNRRVGLLLAQGLALPRILEQLGHVAEGVYTAATVLQRAEALGVDMPISRAVVAVLEGRATPQQACAELMAREAKAES